MASKSPLAKDVNLNVDWKVDMTEFKRKKLPDNVKIVGSI